VLPEDVWQRLGLVAQRDLDFSLADGRLIRRSLSECKFEIAGIAATSRVVLGRADEGRLLGAVTLETLGPVLNPLTRQLMPLHLVLATMRPATASDVSRSV
jgi:hypothetical protein